MGSQELETDVAIGGAGMAGLVAALSLAQRDIDVTIVEKGHRAGGSMYLSNGIIWTYPDVETAREQAPTGNPNLQQLVIERLESDLEWLGGYYEGLRDLPDQYNPDGGWQGDRIEPTEFTSHVVERLRERGHGVRLRTPMSDLTVDKNGAVTGLIADPAEATRLDIKADAVILATGGWQGNAALVEQYLIDDANEIWLRSNPWSTGDGLRVAESVGAKLTRGWRSFYGHNMVAPPAAFDLEEIPDATQYYGAAAVALDVDGRRFTDESESDMENTLAQDTARLADGTAFYVIDHDLYDSDQFGGHVGTQIERARDLGARVVSADSLDELADRLEPLSLNGDHAVETIQEFNAAMTSGRGSSLDPPRAQNRQPIDTPPFYVIEVRPGVTFTTGGLDVSPDMEVLDRSASSSSLNFHPADINDVTTGSVPGLFAAGADVGNINNRHYIGGLAVALVTGRVAAESAVTYLT